MNFINQLLENFKKEKFSSFKDNIWGVDLADIRVATQPGIQGNQGKSRNLILASKVRELSGNLRKSWPKSGKEN